MNPAFDKLADQFPSGCLVTDSRYRVVRANRYFRDEFGHDPQQLCRQSLYALITPASRIICESYVVPLLMHQRSCDEIQLTLLDHQQERIPVIISARRSAESDSGLIFWNIHSARQRDKLYRELLEARRLLEKKAADLKVLSETDELTGLLNRREFSRRCDILLQVNRRSGRAISLLLLDIDHFKSVNDHHGHAVGDAVLRQLGTSLRALARSSDLVARYGGEEFLLLLPDTDAKAAAAMAQRLHEALTAIELEGRGSVTASIGIATSANNNPTEGQRVGGFEGLFRLADSAMYQAKSRGRNQTVIAD